MTFPFLSSLGETLRDPVLRRWRLGRLRGTWRASPKTAPAAPAYLDDLPELSVDNPRQDAFPVIEVKDPANPLRLSLAGGEITVTPAALGAIFGRRATSGAAAVALHSFAWMRGSTHIPAEWVVALWRAWMAAHGQPERGHVAWRPEVAAARAAAVLDFARRDGLPDPGAATLAVLAGHAAAIDAALDANMDSGIGQAGSALYRLGVELGLETAAERGLAVLSHEVERLCGPSGILREDSTGYHLRFTCAYADAWVTARRYGRPEASQLGAILRRLMGVLRALALPGGQPQVGEAPVDFPVAHLSGLLPGAAMDGGWTGELAADERDALRRLRDEAGLDDLESMRADGWLRYDNGLWSGLWHVPPGGWPDLAHHGHQDLGSFELHYGGIPVFVDPGSPPGDAPADVASAYRSSLAHNTLTVEEQDPYPAARRFYSEDFRRAVAGLPPRLQTEFDGVLLYFQGYGRFGGPRDVERRWQFSGSALSIDDKINGTGRYLLQRRLITPLPTVVEDGVAFVSLGEQRLRIEGDVAPSLHPARRWIADGVEEMLTVILFASKPNLPWRGHISIRPE